MKRLMLVFMLVLLVCAISFIQFPFQQELAAQDYPVSIVETGKTPGFDPPRLFLPPIQLLAKLPQNRSLQEPYLINENPDIGEVGAPIDYNFMAQMVLKEVRAFNQLIDPYDNPEHPRPGYTWNLKIFHPGSTPGQLPPEGGPYPVIVFCAGASGSAPQYYNSMDWMGTYYARKGYIFAIPIFIENDDDFSESPIYAISNSVYALQSSQTIDYLRGRFSCLNGKAGRVVDTNHITLIGISFGGYVAQKTAAQDNRVTRLCLLSSVFIYYNQSAWPGFLIDTKDIYDILNLLPKQREMALHVQRFTSPPYILPCPDWDPACDWIPPVDGYLTRVNLTSDPWEPYLCNGEDCGVRDGTYYNYTLYEGPKQDEIKNNGLLAHSGAPDPSNEEAGKELVLQYLDEFFTQFPVN